jgi:hypothetical protein
MMCSLSLRPSGSLCVRNYKFCFMKVLNGENILQKIVVFLFLFLSRRARMFLERRVVE